MGTVNNDIERAGVADAPLLRACNPADIAKQMESITACVRTVMKEGEDFGVIPGTGSKPSLLKSGAEKLAVLFGLAVECDVDERQIRDDHREYSVTVRLVSRASGSVVGSGVGTCSTMESRYRWRHAKSDDKPTGVAVPRDFWDARKQGAAPSDLIAMLAKAVGRPGNFGTKKDDAGSWEIVERGERTGDRVENSDPADQWNTCLKMAKKRALVDAMLTTTAASAFFSQDLEDMREELERAPAPAAPEPQRRTVESTSTPAARPAPQVRPADGPIVWRDDRYTGPLTALEGIAGAVEALSEKPTDRGGKIYGVKINGTWYSHFSDTAQGLLSQAKQAGLELHFGVAMRGNYKNLHAFREENDPGPAPEVVDVAAGCAGPDADRMGDSEDSDPLGADRVPF